MRTPALITLCLLMALPAVSQTRVVKGKITTFNLYPVQNVEVISKKTKSAIQTDSLGQFELVCNEKDMILIKTKVFEPYGLRITPEIDFVSANLVFKDSKKNRELATGLGYVKADQLSYAVSHLSHENNNFCNYSDIKSLLRNAFPEVEVDSQGKVSVRGQKSINLSTEAVYVVDEMVVKDISFLNPCDIATIKVQKSGGTAVYGTQAINGVLIIETKGHKKKAGD